jgi:NADH dehydrogenase FAD-containing subunit
MTRVLLAGGGHTHLIAGPLLAQGAAAGVEVVLLAPTPRLLYSGMMPGWLAGQYGFDDCAIDLGRVARQAGLGWIEDTLVDVDFAGREAVGASGRRYGYDLLSLNVGSANLTGTREPGSTVTVLGAKPFAEFVTGWQRWLDLAPPAPRCVVVGGGAAAVEIAFALAARLASGRLGTGGSVALAASGPALLQGLAPRAGRLAHRSLVRRGVAVHLGRQYVGVAGACVRLVDTAPAPDAPVRPRPGVAGSEGLAADLVVVATGARPPGWLTAAAVRGGLAVGADGGVAVDDCLRSTSRPEVFASGDCASFVDSPVPKSGVHALRQGPPLAASILAHLDGRGTACAAAARYRPQARALALLNRCDGTAIAAWGPVGLAGAAAWRWKDRIDRRFVARFP